MNTAESLGNGAGLGARPAIQFHDAAGHRSFGSYLRWLEQSGAQTKQEWQEFVNCLTTNLTAFFREQHHFPVFGTELIKHTSRRTQIWCKAASTGEEPYSLAITVIEALGSNADVEITCSDIDTKVLAKAAGGVYPAESRGGLSPGRLRQHFLRGKGVNSGTIRVKRELQRLVEFRAFNLMDARWSLGEPFEIGFCCNVMIYCDAAPRARGHASRVAPARLAVCWSLGKCFRVGRSVSPAR